MFENTEEVLCRTIITQKKFSTGPLNYNYHNTYKLEKIQLNKEATFVKVKNLPCVVRGNQLTKVIEIQYGDRKFYIEDVYVLSGRKSDQGSTKRDSKHEMSALSSQNQDSTLKDFAKNEAKKICLFRKGNAQKKTHRRNTKNVAKNFCKAFLSYLSDQKKRKPDSEKIQNIIRQVKSLIGDKKYYNNNVIWKIISSNVCKEQFKVFLQEKAKLWIQKSKTEYKDVHYQAIDVYLRLYQKMTFLQGEQQEDDEQMQGSSE